TGYRVATSRSRLRNDAAACWPVPATVPGMSAVPRSAGDWADPPPVAAAGFAAAVFAAAGLVGTAAGEVASGFVGAGPDWPPPADGVSGAVAWRVAEKDPSACSTSVIDGWGSPGVETTR